MKGSRPEQLTCAHLYLDIAKSGYLFRGFSGGVKQDWHIWCHGTSQSKIMQVSSGKICTKGHFNDFNIPGIRWNQFHLESVG